MIFFDNAPYLNDLTDADDVRHRGASRTAQELGAVQDFHMAHENDLPAAPIDVSSVYEVKESELLSTTERDWSRDIVEYDEAGNPTFEQTGYMHNFVSGIVFDYMNKSGEYAPAVTPKLGDLTGMEVKPHQGLARPAAGLYQHQMETQYEAKRLAQHEGLTPAEISQWGLEYTGQLNYDDTSILGAWFNLDTLPPDVAFAQAAMLDMYKRLPNWTANGSIRMLKGIVTSPTTYFGLGVGGLTAKALLKSGAAVGAKQSLRNALLSRAFPDKFMKGLGVATVFSGETGAYTGMVDYIHQRLEHGGSEEPFVWNQQRTLKAAEMGFAIGTVAAGAGLAVSHAVGAGVSAFRTAADTAAAGGRGATRRPEEVVLKGPDVNLPVWTGNQPGATMGSFGGLPGAAAALKPVTQATDLSPAGFYSAVRRAVDTLPQEKGAASQMRAMIAKSEGVKAEEMAWIGLDEFLKGRKNVTKQEIADFVDANQVEVVAITKDLDTTAAREESMLLQEQRMAGKITDAELLAGETAISARTAQYATEADNINLPGGENYREVLLTLPHTPRSQVKPTETASAPFMDEWNRLGAEIDASRSELDQARLDMSPQYAGIMERVSNLESQRNDLHRKMVDATIAESGGRLGRVPFTAGHMDEPNVLAWVRMDDRIGPNGERILFLQEVQSDWHQKGRKLRKAEIKRIAKENNITKEEAAKQVPDDFGYKTPEKLQRFAENRAAQDDLHRKSQNIFNDLDESHNIGGTLLPDGRGIRLWSRDIIENNDYKNIGRVNENGTYYIDEGYAAKNPAVVAKIKETAEINAEIGRLKGEAPYIGAVPDAPFKKTSQWGPMALRRIIRMAAEEGYDSVAWTPGKIQAERYDLSRVISEINYNPKTQRLFAYEKDGYVPAISEKVSKDDLPDHIGKEAAERLLATDLSIIPTDKGDTSQHILKGQDLQVGGEGMKGFYDKMLKGFAAKFGKKFGAKVGTTKIDWSELSGPLVSDDVRVFHDLDDVRVFHDLSEEFWSNLSLSERQQLRREAEEARTSSTEVWTIPITPKMRESVLKKGVAMFSAAGAAMADAGMAGAETIPLDQNLPKSEDTTGSFLGSVRSVADVLLGDPPPEIEHAPRGGGQRMKVKVKAEQQKQNRYGLPK